MQKIWKFSLLLLISAFISAQEEPTEEFLWNRWEERTVDCVSSGKKDHCVLLAPNSKNPPDTRKFKCRREPMPQNDWNKLAVNSTTRLACPLNCPIDYDLSVLQKKPYVNKNCQKYYTYGKYRDTKENDWYLWMTEPCVAAISTHCRYHDVPAIQKSGKDFEKSSQNPQIKESEQRKKAAAV